MFGSLHVYMEDSVYIHTPVPTECIYMNLYECANNVSIETLVHKHSQLSVSTGSASSYSTGYQRTEDVYCVVIFCVVRPVLVNSLLNFQRPFLC